MKPVYLKVATSPEHSIDIRRDVVPYFHNPWHFHPELELTLILKGTGSRFVGDSIDHFGENELTLIGPNLPHYWRSDPVYYQQKPGLNAEAVIIRFAQDFAGKDLFRIPEMHAVADLLERSRRGLKITGAARASISGKMLSMQELSGAERIIALLQILNTLAVSPEYTFLSSMGFVNHYSKSDSERINTIYDYLLTNFRKPMQLEEVAAAACMNPAAFCRFFKLKTGKTFVQFLNELRIGYACKLLVHHQYPVSRVSYECGFRYQSYFIKQFRKYTRQTPLEYLRKHS